MKPGPSRAAERLWLGGALLFTFLFTARTMAPAFRAGAIQDDALQHVFWMLRYRDSELFRDDLYADYFQSLAPAGYQAIYRILSLGVDPFDASKLLPPILGAVSALFTFLLVRRLHPSPMAAFLATVLLSWYVWQYDDLASATPRAFLLPSLAAMLWCLVSGRLALAVVVATLAALLYPLGGVLGVGLLGAGLLSLEVGWRGREAGTAPTGRGSIWLAFVAAATLVGLVLLPSVLGASAYGPTVTAGEARTMPEFGERGRNAFFGGSAYQFWLESYRSGLNLRVADALVPQLPLLFEYAALAALLPLVLRLRHRLPAAGLLDGRAAILLHLLAVSFGLFFLAHLLLFRLYLPSRYVQWSVPLVLSISAGLALAILLEEAVARLRAPRLANPAGLLALLFAAGVALYPAEYHAGFQRDRHPAITAYLLAQPKDVLIAAPPTEADALAAMSRRRVLVAREYALAYHLGYYGEVERRTRDLIEAYYDEGTRRLGVLVDRYGVDLFLVQYAAFHPTTFRRAWGSGFEPFTTAIAARLDRPRRYALQDLARRCAVVDDGTLALVPASCLRPAPTPTALLRRDEDPADQVGQDPRQAAREQQEQPDQPHQPDR